MAHHVAENEPPGEPHYLWDDTGDTDERDADHDISGPTTEPPQEPWYSAVSTVIALGAIGVVAVGIVVSAVLVVSRESVGPTAAVVPTIPITTTAPTAAPSTTRTSSPTTTQAPSSVPPSTSSAIITTTVEPPPKPPETSTHHSSTPGPPSSVHPTPHPAFPHQTTDFLGPPGTNG